MNIIKKRVIICTIAAALLASLLAPAAYAHRMIIRFEEPGLLRVIYDDNSIARRAEIVLLDGDNKELAKGPVNQDGYFSYNKSLKPKLAVADDGLGHRTQLDLTVSQREEIPVAAKALLGVAILVF
ncbi:MAG: hypothetical protein KGZ96_09435, partial [Clostridia bacterium]|nr:hypothetical protein [Clostridia bacterium]